MHSTYKNSNRVDLKINVPLPSVLPAHHLVNILRAISIIVPAAATEEFTVPWAMWTGQADRKRTG